MISVLPTSGNLIHPWEDSTCVIPPCQVPSGPSSQTWTFSGRTYPLSRLCLLILHTTFLSHLPGNFPLSRNGSLLVTSWLWNEETAGERRGWNEAETKFSVCRFHLHSRTVCGGSKEKWVIELVSCFNRTGESFPPLPQVLSPGLWTSTLQFSLP